MENTLLLKSTQWCVAVDVFFCDVSPNKLQYTLSQLSGGVAVDVILRDAIVPINCNTL